MMIDREEEGENYFKDDTNAIFEQIQEIGNTNLLNELMMSIPHLKKNPEEEQQHYNPSPSASSS